MRPLMKSVVVMLVLALVLSPGAVSAQGASDSMENAPTVRRAAIEGVDCPAAGMAVLEPISGRLIMAKDPDRKLPMASTTKIMTAITVIEHTKVLDKTVVVPDEAVGVEGSSIYLCHHNGSHNIHTHMVCFDNNSRLQRSR